MIVFLDIRVFKLKINFICTSGKSNFLDARIGHLKRPLILANELSSDDNKMVKHIYEWFGYDTDSSGWSALLKLIRDVLIIL